MARSPLVPPSQSTMPLDELLEPTAAPTVRQGATTTLADLADPDRTLFDSNLTRDPDLDYAKQPALELPLLASRYRTSDIIGRGASGRVYRALDLLTDEVVAIKVIQAPTTNQFDRIRSEVTALRWLDLPGVARMRDDGLEDGQYFVVMDLVSGQPFLGPTQQTWDSIQASVLALLDILARVHLAGIVHRDLKPANVLVDDSGQPALVDFGLARGDALSTDWDRCGTPRYVAPEQALGLSSGPQADLYSLGVMLYECLSGGYLPQPQGQPQGQPQEQPGDLLVRRVSARPVPLQQVAPQVDAVVSGVVDSLVQLRPEDRPLSALAVIDQLGGRPPMALGSTLVQVLGQQDFVAERALRQLFAGPDCFLHLAEDAAAVLWQRTGGRVALVAEELQAWVAGGLCSWDGPLLTITRVSIETLRVSARLGMAAPAHPDLSPAALALLTAARRAWPDTDPAILGELSGLAGDAFLGAVDQLIASGDVWRLPDHRLGVRPVVLPLREEAERVAQAHLAGLLPDTSQSRLRHLMLGGARAAELLPVAQRVIEDLLREGREPEALAVLDLVLPLTRMGLGDPAGEEALLVDWAWAALMQQRPSAIERALFELGRAVCRTALVEQVEALLYAARVGFRGEPVRFSVLVGALPPFRDPRLESQRVGLIYGAACQVSLEAGQEVLNGLDAWALRSTSAQAKLDRWRGLQAYRMGDYEQAAELQMQAADLAQNPAQRVLALSNAAFALLDGGHLEASGRVAERVGRLASKLRHPLLEARACCCQRSVIYRSGGSLEPRTDLVDAAQSIYDWLAGQFCITEVGFALRGGYTDLARELSQRGAAAFQIGGFLPGQLLLEAAGVAATPTVDLAEAARLCAQARALDDTSFAVQIIGLVAMAVPSPRRPDAVTAAVDALPGLIASLGNVDAEAIIDIITVAEALRGQPLLASSPAMVDPAAPSLRPTSTLTPAAEPT